MAGQPARRAFPSASFGNMPATTRSLGIRFHMGTKVPPNSFRPKKNIVVYLNGFGLAGSGWRARYHDSQGTTVDTQGTCWASHTVATGLVVSGGDVVRIMSTLFCRMSSRATCDGRLGFGGLSFTRRCTLMVVLPTLK